MADLASILADPNYVNANEATKRAIFDKFSAQDPNFTEANPATQDAIRERFGVPNLKAPAPRAEIPYVPGANRTRADIAPAEDVPRTFMQRVLGTVAAPIDVAATMADATWRATWANPVAGLLTGRTPEQVMQDVRQPQTPEGRAALEYVGKATSWLPPVIGTGAISTGLAPGGGAYRAAIKQGAQPIIAPVMKAVEPVVQAVRDRQLVAQGERALESYARGPQIDAAKDAQRLGIALNPTDIDPTSLTARMVSAGAGPKGAPAIEKVNRPKVNDVARQDMGLEPTAQLNGKDAFNRARAKVAEPYNAVNELPITVADDAVRQRLESLRLDPGIIGPKEYASSVNAIIDSAIEQTGKGMTGRQLLANVQVLRERARRTYNNASATIEALDIADTNLAVANTLESMIDANIFNPKLLDQFRAARQQMAKIYTYEAATNFNTGFVDPLKLARITAKDNGLTGDLAALGRIAGNFPSAFKASAEAKWYSPPRIVRSSLGGAIGAGLAAPFFGETGALVGMGLGAGAGEIGSAWLAKHMASPGYQSGLTVPDFRVPVNRLAAQAAAPTPNVPALYDWRNAMVQPGDVIGYAADGSPITAEQAFSRPNWVPGRPTPDVRVVRPEGGPPQLPPPSAEGTMGALRAEDVRRAGVSRAIGQEAEAKQAAAEAAARRPAAGEVMLELDPVTGRLREASQGIKGATPDTFRNFGADLESAANKVAAGKLFDLTASEKVAWEKTKVDLAEVSPSFRSLTDKALTEKMMDRQWVESAITKAREKVAAFDEIARRAKDAQERQRAIADKVRMQMDVLSRLEALEERLRAPRPVSGTAQGPKTRAAQRNQLRPSAESENALAP